MKLRRGVVALVGSAFLLAGCGGGDLPTRSEFIDQVTDQMGADVSGSLEDAGISSEKATEIMESFIGCIYDEIKDDEELVQKAYDDTIDEAALESQAAACGQKMTEDVTQAGLDAAGG